MQVWKRLRQTGKIGDWLRLIWHMISTAVFTWLTVHGKN